MRLDRVETPSVSPPQTYGMPIFETAIAQRARACARRSRGSAKAESCARAFCDGPVAAVARITASECAASARVIGSHG